MRRMEFRRKTNPRQSYALWETIKSNRCRRIRGGDGIILLQFGAQEALQDSRRTYRTSGWASSMARIKVVPDLGTPPMNINGISRLYE